MFFIYVIRSLSNGKIYIGHTVNIEKRLRRHNGLDVRKPTSFTSRIQGPWVLVYREVFLTRIEARTREKQLKGSRGRAYIKKIIWDTPS